MSLHPGERCVVIESVKPGHKPLAEDGWDKVRSANITAAPTVLRLSQWRLEARLHNISDDWSHARFNLPARSSSRFRLANTFVRIAQSPSWMLWWSGLMPPTRSIFAHGKGGRL